MKFAIRLCRNHDGASAAEFALVLPLLILLLLGMVDAGRFMWEYNQAEKATQMGVRYAVVTNMVPSGLASYSFATQGGVLAGSTIPNNAGAGTGWFESATCTSSSCGSCTGSMCGSIGFDSVAFANIVDRMRSFYPRIQQGNVQIEYRNVGLGYAGDPNGPDVAPLVTVRLTGLSFQPFSTMIFGTGVAMPDFRAALTLEDGADNCIRPCTPKAN